MKIIASESIKKIAILTSGGDAPGMNAAIRGVVRAGIKAGLDVYGIYDGYAGLFNNKIKQLSRYDVSDVINRGGTMLGSARFNEFRDPNIRAKCAEILRTHGIEALVVIGGDGSYQGAKCLMEEQGIKCVGIPGTIDNDIAGTDYTIGYQTALATAVEAVDRLRDTCSSHHRISILEIMGRHCSDLTIATGIAGGAEYVITPEKGFDKEELINNIDRCIKAGKRHAIICITELLCDVNQLAQEIEVRVGKETRATVLGHVQRGGSPCAFDRILASRMGAYAVDLLVAGEGGCCVGIENEKMIHHEISHIINHMCHKFKSNLLELTGRLE